MTVVSHFLIKLSKHTALLVSVLILAHTSGRYEASQIAILGLAVASALFHLTGQAFQRRSFGKSVRMVGSNDSGAPSA